MTADIRRALAYPYALEKTSYVLRDGQVCPWDDAQIFDGRVPVLACGSNQSPVQLARKFPKGLVPVMAGWLSGYDSVYSAHFTAYGSIAATLMAQEGVTSHQMITWLDDEQLSEMHQSESLGVNYDYVALIDIEFHADMGGQLRSAHTYLSLHGPLMLNGKPVSLNEIKAKGRSTRSLSQEEVQKIICTDLAPSLTLDQFITENITRVEIRKARTAALKA